MLEDPAEVTRVRTERRSTSMEDNERDADSVVIPGPAEHYCYIFGVRLRKCSELEPTEIAFLVFANISLIMAIAMSAYRVHTSAHGSMDYIFAVLLLVQLLFVYYYIFHGVFMERPYEILVSLLTVLIVMVYCIVDYSTSEPPKRTDLKKVRLAIICLLGPIDIGLGMVVSIKFLEGPTGIMCRLVGHSIPLQKICKYYFRFTAFLGFDFQIVLVLLILILSDEANKMSQAEKLIIGIGVPLSIIAIVIGRIGIRLENKVLSYIFLSFCVAEPAYIVYLFDRFGLKLEQAKKMKDKGHKILYGSIIAAGVVGMVIRLLLVILAIIVIFNFGKGLKEKLYPVEQPPSGDAYQKHEDENPTETS
eukprot:gene11182-12356_t